MIKDIYEKIKDLEGNEFANAVLENCADYYSYKDWLFIDFMEDSCRVIARAGDCDAVEAAKELGVMDDYYGFKDYYDSGGLILGDEGAFNHAIFDFYYNHNQELDLYAIAKNKRHILEYLEEWMEEEEGL